MVRSGHALQAQVGYKQLRLVVVTCTIYTSGNEKMPCSPTFNLLFSAGDIPLVLYVYIAPKIVIIISTLVFHIVRFYPSRGIIDKLN